MYWSILFTGANPRRPRPAFSFAKSALASLAVTLGVIGPATRDAFAQEVSAPGGYQFFVTPYLWLASVHATTTTPLARVPEVNSNVSSIDLLSHLDRGPIMGSF